jgi:hypothetical protein
LRFRRWLRVARYRPDELREADFGKGHHKVRGQELEMARQLIANLTAD